MAKVNIAGCVRFAMRHCDRRMPRFATWSLVTDEVPWHPRDGAGACVFRGRMWLLGGWNHQEPLNFPREEGSNCAQVWSSADGRAWRLELARAPWPPRHLSGFLVHDDEMWLVGGDNSLVSSTATQTITTVLLRTRTFLTCLNRANYLPAIGILPERRVEVTGRIALGMCARDRTLARPRQPPGRLVQREAMGHGWAGQCTKMGRF